MDRRAYRHYCSSNSMVQLQMRGKTYLWNDLFMSFFSGKLGGRLECALLLMCLKYAVKIKVTPVETQTDRHRKFHSYTQSGDSTHSFTHGEVLRLDCPNTKLPCGDHRHWPPPVQGSLSGHGGGGSGGRRERGRGSWGCWLRGDTGIPLDCPLSRETLKHTCTHTYIISRSEEHTSELQSR